MTDAVLGREGILQLLDEVASRLDGDAQAILIVVGGSFMALKGLRSTTADVDTVTRLDEATKAVIETIASEHDLEPDWLNDRAAGFVPVGLDVAECDTLLDTEALLVLCPPHDFVFLMKLLANRPGDYDDMVALWPNCSFVTCEVAVQRFYAAYPHIEEDPYLTDYVAGIAAQAL
jgi:hypothetical protein